MVFNRQKIILFFLILGLVIYFFFFLEINYAYLPPARKLIPFVPHPSSENPAVIELGRKTFYTETFGNEVFFSDILGILEGPLNPGALAQAILGLKGQGTTDLKIESSTGKKISTGLDVVQGTRIPLGVKVNFKQGRLRIGMTCAACHSTVDPVHHYVLEGVPNKDLQAGFLLAAGSNSASFFVHTGIKSLEPFANDRSAQVMSTQGSMQSLPDPLALEKSIDDIFLEWPAGSFDSTPDLKNNAVQIPDTFTLGEHPYGWTGFAGIGPFNGLSSLNNNAHGFHSDPFVYTDSSQVLFGIDPEIYLGTLLQNAADSKYRFEASSQKKPAEFFKRLDPTPGKAGINDWVELPTFPKASFIAAHGALIGKNGFKVWEQNNAMSAWMNTLRPPFYSVKSPPEEMSRGRMIFEKASCGACHAGNFLTNTRVIPLYQILTEPRRAKAHSDMERNFEDSVLFSPKTPVPLPGEPKVLPVPISPDQLAQAQLAWAFRGTPGGYKVPGLQGLSWTAPYLHDGSAGDVQGHADAEKSLEILLKRNLRKENIQGHEFWVDQEAGYSEEDVKALIQYLLSL